MNRPTNDEKVKALLQKHGLDPENQAMMAAVKEAFVAGANVDCMVLKKTDIKEEKNDVT